MTPRLALMLLTVLAGGCEQAAPATGRYYWGAEVNIVCPCNEEDHVEDREKSSGEICFWVRAEPEVLNPLKSFVQRKTDRPYQPVYIEYRGRLLAEPAVGFGANYDGLMALDEIIRTSTDIPPSCSDPSRTEP